MSNSIKQLIDSRKVLKNEIDGEVAHCMTDDWPNSELKKLGH